MKNTHSLSQDNLPQANNPLAASLKFLRQHEVIYLSAKDSRIFLETLEKPVQFNDKLKAALKAHKRLVISQ